MNTEIEALIKLLDDPDESIYNAVNNKLHSYGNELLPILETYTGTITNTIQQARLELLIKQFQYNDIKNDLTNWCTQPHNDLLYGAFIIAKLQNYNANYNVISTEVNQLKKDIWIELNSYLTPLEKVNIINNIVFKYNRYGGTEINYTKQQEFFIPNLIQIKKGNSFSLIILYTVLAQMLDVPIVALKFPKQMILCYLDTHLDYSNKAENNFFKIKFFIDPIFGAIISHNDVELFFRRMNVPPTVSYFRPLSNKKILQTILIEYAKCKTDNEISITTTDLETLIKILD